MKACCSLTTTPSRAAAIAGSTSSAIVLEPERAQRLFEAGRSSVDAVRGDPDVEDLDGVRSVKQNRDRDQFRLGHGALAARHLDEEVEQLRVPAGLAGQHVAAGSESRQRALRSKRRHHRGNRGVDRVAALSKRPRSGLGGNRMPSRNDSARIHPLTLSGARPDRERPSGPVRTLGVRARSPRAATRSSSPCRRDARRGAASSPCWCRPRDARSWSNRRPCGRDRRSVWRSP